MQDQGQLTYLEGAWIGDETWRLQRAKPARRGVGSNMRSSGSQLMGDRTNSGVLKDDGKVSSLTESVSGSHQKVVFEL